MNKMTSLVAIAVALSLAAGCAPRNRTLPPEPVSGSTPGDLDGSQDGSISGTAVPGSRADFIQSVPSDRVFFALDSYALDGESRSPDPGRIDHGRRVRLPG